MSYSGLGRSGPFGRPEPTSGARGSLPNGPEPLEPVFDLPTRELIIETKLINFNKRGEI